MKSLVTIITVCYNAENDIKKTIESMLSQDFSNIEYLIIDGGSKDKTVDIIKNYIPLFEAKRIVFKYISEKDKGTYDAMNKGAKMAQGEWINYMNAGDSFYKTTSLSDFFKNCHYISNEVGVLYGDTLEEYDFGEGISLCKDNENSNPTMPFCHQSSFVRSELMRKYKFNISYKIIADHDLFYRLRKDNISFKYIPVVVARYNGQYGLSATNPLRLRLEGLKVHEINNKWYYPFALLWTYVRYGLVQPFKTYMPKCVSDGYMKYKRKYIK